MDIQNIVDTLVYTVNLATKQESAKEYSLGKLIKDLGSHDKDLEVVVDDGTFPLVKEVGYALEDDPKETSEYIGDFYSYNKNTETVFSSWRGSYNSLAISYDSDNQIIKVKDLLGMAEFIEDKYLCGYKGGDFLMDEGTPIYIDNCGECRSIKLIGTKIEDNKVILITRKEEG